MKKWLFILVALSFKYAAAQELMVFSAPYLPGNDTVLIVKPASSLLHTKKFPAVIMLHGWSGNYKGWNQMVNLQKYADDYQFVIICPDGFYDSYYLNSPVVANSQYESFFFGMLLPELKAKLPIDSTKIFVTGLSMGGHGALYLFCQRPDLFLSAGSMSGVHDLTASSQKKKSLSRILGEYSKNRKKFKEYSVLKKVENLKGLDKHILFDCGTEDYLYKCNNALRKKCDKLKIQATYISQPGAHNVSYWQNAVKYHFDFFAKKCGQ